MDVISNDSFFGGSGGLGVRWRGNQGFDASHSPVSLAAINKKQDDGWVHLMEFL